MVHMIQRSLRAHGREMPAQLYQHQGPSAREKGSLGVMSVTLTIVGAVQEHEEGICSGHSHGTKRLPVIGIVQLRWYPPER